MAWTTKPPAGTQLDFTNPINNGLVGCWIFNEGTGTLVNDLSGNGNNGTLVGMSEPSTSTSGWNIDTNGEHVLTFDGIDDYIYTNTSVITQTTPFTVSVTINSNYWIPAGFNVIVGNNNNYGGGFLLTNQDNGLKFMLFTAGGSWAGRADTALPPINTILNITAVYDGINAMLYVNNTLHSSVNVFDYSIMGSGNLAFVKFNNQIVYSGNIKDTRIWNRALLSSERSTLYTTPYSMFLGSESCPPLTCNLSIT